MEGIGNTTIVLLVVLSVGLIVPELVRKIKLPYVSVLIIIGAIIGPFGFGFVQPDQTIEFFGFLGFTFLMFMAGLEVEFRSVKEHAKSISIMALMNGLVPFVVGVSLTRAFGYDWLAALMVGIIFISSSVAIIIPALRSTKLYKQKEGKQIISAVILEDVASLILLAIVLQTVSPVTNFPLPIYFLVLILSFIVMKLILPKLATLMLKTKWLSRKETHEEQLQFVILVLIATLAYFSAIGVHPILAAFMVGFLLSDVITAPVIKEKIHTLGYGLFVPVFFFIVGMKMNLLIFTQLDFQNVIIITLVVSVIASKFLSGYVAGRLVKLSGRHSAVFGLVSTTQLTTTLAATFAAASLDILDTTLVTAIIMVTIITTIFVPIAVRAFTQNGIK